MAVILSVLGILPFFRVFTGSITFVAFIIHIVSLFLPVNIGTAIQEKISDACFYVVAPKRVTISYESIKKGEVEFFRKDGKPKVWYYKKEDGTFELFNGEGHHPTYEVKLKPVTREIITIIEKQLDKDEKERQAKIEQECIRQKQARQEQAKKEELEREILNKEKQKKEQLDREETSRKDLIKPGIYNDRGKTRAFWEWFKGIFTPG